MADIRVHDHGSIVIITGASVAGIEWLEEHIDPDAQRWGNGFVAEPRYVAPIIEDAIGDGLEVA